MKKISKGKEPRSLKNHRSTPHSDYDNFANKDELRHALVTEQQGLCCYCMARIKPDRRAMKIEHWRCQAYYRGKELDYRNLLGACLGGEGRPFVLQHCDTRKGNDDLLWNPAEPAHAIEARVQYDLDGTIRSSNTTFDNQLNQVLNLNLPIFRANRKKVLDVVLDWWKKEKAKLQGPVPREAYERMKNKYAADAGELTPYCQVAVWLLNQKLARLP